MSEASTVVCVKVQSCNPAWGNREIAVSYLLSRTLRHCVFNGCSVFILAVNSYMYIVVHCSRDVCRQWPREVNGAN